MEFSKTKNPNTSSSLWSTYGHNKFDKVSMSDMYQIRVPIGYGYKQEQMYWLEVSLVMKGEVSSIIANFIPIYSIWLM